MFQSHPPSVHLKKNPSNLDYLQFDTTAGLTAANASIHDDRSAQVTPYLSKPGAALTDMQGTIAQYEQPSDFRLNQGLDTTTLRPLARVARESRSSPNTPTHTAEVTASSMSHQGSRGDTFNTHKVSACLPSKYDNYFEEFQIQELSAFTGNLKERFGDALGSAVEIGQGIVEELTKEFASVSNQLRDLTKKEQYKTDQKWPKSFTTPNLTYKRHTLAASSLDNQRTYDQERHWQAATLDDIYRRRGLIWQQMNLLKKSLDVGKRQIEEVCPHLSTPYGHNAPFLYRLKSEMREWELLWQTVTIECENAKLARERMTTLARLWGVMLEGEGDTRRKGEHLERK
ncbi:hypothetical protein MMC13_008347 [Lambiella insularis]|nr:hypothetical protein [Lambiella insularis]